MKTISPNNSNLDRRPSAPAILPVESGIYHVAMLSRYPELLHGVSTRLSPNGDDWNLSARRGTPAHPPSWERTQSNRQLLAERLGVRLDRMIGCQQVHGSLVVVVNQEDAGRGMAPDVPSVQGADAMVTDTPGIYLMALAADCPPVFLYDPARHAVGLVHSGWRGTVARIAANAVEAMVDNFGSDPRDIVAAIGPGIGPCCYAVGPDVIREAESAFFGAWNTDEPLLETRDDATHFNLWEAIHRTLLNAGLRPGNITVERVCTADHFDVFYSHRAEKGVCGLFGAVIGVRET